MTALIRAPLCGEVLGADDAVTVIAALHPTSPSRETLTAPAERTRSQIARTGAMRPTRLETCGKATTRVRGVSNSASA